MAVPAWRRGERIDLLTQFDSAKKDGGPFNVEEATLAGDTKTRDSPRRPMDASTFTPAFPTMAG